MKTSLEKVGHFIDREGEIAGEVRIVSGWNAVGHEVSLAILTFFIHAYVLTQGVDGIVPFPEFRETGSAMNTTCQTVRDLEPLSHHINAVLEHADPEHYADVLELRDLVRKSRASYDVLAGSDVLVYEGREILYNRQSGLHTDSQDPHLGWALLAGLGLHKGGYVHFPHLGLRVRLEPGDVVALHGRVVPHQIEEWVGQRITIPHFTHSSLWRAFGKHSVFLD